VIKTEVRKCTGCLKEKPVEDFRTWSRGPGGRVHRCSACVKLWPSSSKKYPYDHAKVIKGYGISVEQYEAMKKEQDGCCVICRTTPDINLLVDHDHVTGAVRGLLCRLCNTALGSFRDDPELLERAITYLKKES
jgi:hypothetical protein